MQKIAFKVSAKAARLIGRESVSNAEGAIGELVKNTYDADADACGICFVKRFETAPKSLDKFDYEWLLSREPLFSEMYKKLKNEEVYQLQTSNISKNVSEKIAVALDKFYDLWIIDNGTGMSSTVIEESWMVIGTEFKEDNIYSDDGRTRTGAKGIGRFALDRLGASCNLYSFTKTDGAINWNIRWDDFDGSGKTLDQVNAQFTNITADHSIVLKNFSHQMGLRSQVEETHFSKKKTGTFIRISHLRDNWDQHQIHKLERSVSALIPPLEQSPLDIYLFHQTLRQDYIKITPALLDEYDYKVKALFTGTDVKFTVFRNELVPHEIDLKVFEREEMKRENYTLSDFKKEAVSYTKTLQQLFGELEEEAQEKFKNVGEFSFSLLFFKRTMPGAHDRKIYPYRDFRGSPRKAWLDEYAGIKIYRDHFAVRPYGDVGSRAFDWLALGQRVSKNPAQASRKGWRANPQNLAGTVSISRVTNPDLYDQVTREGLIENSVFDHFRTLLLRMIQEFEDDRSHVLYNLSEAYKAENKPARTISKGTETAARLLKNPKTATAKDAQTLAEALVAQSEEMDDLQEEQAMMRSLATLGTVLVSFSHEMGQLQSTMGSRSSELMGVLDSYIGPNDGDTGRSTFHPYSILEDWAEDDKKVKQWFTFALSSVRANKRRRGWVDLPEYLGNSKKSWKGFLEPRKISFSLECDDDYHPEILAFPIDLESIFNNLLINSVEALVSNRHTGSRNISIKILEEDTKTVKIVYTDNGPGIDPSIVPPSKIFDYNITTKRDEKNNLVGTGLGMWILNTIVREYRGVTKAFQPSGEYGFKVEIYLPIRESS